MVEGFHVIHYDSIGSTNDEAFRLAREGASHGTVVTARTQTAGRGRTGRGWQSPPGNLYLSVLLRLSLPSARVAEVSFVAALAVAETVDAFVPRRVRLKWPNDVLVDGAKIAGILIEQADGVAVLGIGVNVAHFPTGLTYPVTALLHVMLGEGRASAPSSASTRVDARAKREHDEGGWVTSIRDTLLQILARRLASWRADGFAPIRAGWLARAHPPGTPLRAGAIEGSFAGIDTDGALLLDTPAGRIRIVGGEVQVR